MDEKLISMQLHEKEAYSKNLIKNVYDRYGDDVGVAWSGGKDSTTLLHLIKSLFNGKVPWKVFTIDTGVEFKEIIEFIHKIHKEWGFELITLSNKEALKTLEIAKNKVECCYLLKTIPINKAIADYKLKALLVGLRWDEQEARINEKFFAQRDNPFHMRVYPILHFKEIDIWTYIKKYNIPYCELYKKGYRSIDCEPCTKLYSGEGHERMSRDQDKEKVMKRLREMGYF
ncbi:phosphoadenosine phosphosulfate reductase family protein [Thermodesulfovibrio sp. TK110]